MQPWWYFGTSITYAVSRPRNAMLHTSTFVILSALLGFVSAQTVTEYGQCGGQGWTGATSESYRWLYGPIILINVVCVSGTVCTVVNPYYSQCLPGTATSPTSSSSHSTTSASSSSSASSPSSTATSGAGGYIQITSGNSSFTMYSGCNQPG